MGKKLSKRLQAIADLVPAGAFLADVGSDHAYLPISLIQSGKISYAQAIDNKMGPFLRMKANVAEARLESHIVLSRSDGISDIRPDVNCIALAGIGGLLACDLLEAHPEKLPAVSHIIVDPHRDLRSVRARVSALGYEIEDERMVREDKIYYSIIRFKKCAVPPKYSDEQLNFGPKLIERMEPIFLDFIEEQRKKVNTLLNGPALPKERRAYVLRVYRSCSKLLKQGGRL